MLRTRRLGGVEGIELTLLYDTRAHALDVFGAQNRIFENAIDRARRVYREHRLVRLDENGFRRACS